LKKKVYKENILIEIDKLYIDRLKRLLKKEFKMKLLTYKGNDNIRKLLAEVPYEWRATGTYGIEKILKNGYISSVFIIYVKKEDLRGWEEYLRSNGVMPARILANLKLVGVDKLPAPSYQDPNVVNLRKLIRDVYKMAPRYRETHPEIINYLRSRMNNNKTKS